MNKLLLVCFLIPSFTAKSQVTFPAPGASWHYAKSSFGGPQIYNETATVGSNTVIAGHLCTVINGLRYFNYCGSSGPTYFYTSNDSVYFYNIFTQNSWQLLYNFNAAQGQSWSFIFDAQSWGGNIDTITVSVDSVGGTSINSFPLKTLYVKYDQLMRASTSMPFHAITYSAIYDRIGDVGYLLNFQYDLNGWCDDGGLQFLCYQDSLMSVYQHDSLSCTFTNVGIEEINAEAEVQVFPNPASDHFTVSIPGEPECSFRLMDMLGNIAGIGKNRMGLSPVAEGVYFVEVKTTRGMMVRRKVIIAR